VEPEFRVLLYPHRAGEPMPKTAWSEDRTELTVELGGQKDVYTFARSNRGRTVFAQARDGSTVHVVEGAPPAPRLAGIEQWYGAEAGYGGHAYSVPRELRANVFPFHQRATVAFAAPAAGSVIRYTTDGSEPDAKAHLYKGPFTLKDRSVVKARTFAEDWPCGPGQSGTFSAEFTPRAPVRAAATEETGLKPGLLCDLYEAYLTIYDRDDGYFSGRKDMLPDLDDRMPVLQTVTEAFDTPAYRSKIDPVLQVQGYYVYSGYIRVPATGLYRFRLHAPGPVEFTLSDEPVIRHHGPYYLSLRDRYGALVLAEGLHKLEMTVCDPVLWKGDPVDTEERGAVLQSDPPMQVDLALMGPGDAGYRPMGGTVLWRIPSGPHEAGRPRE
jgi:hypothetical protein